MFFDFMHDLLIIIKNGNNYQNIVELTTLFILRLKWSLYVHVHVHTLHIWAMYPIIKFIYQKPQKPRWDLSLDFRKILNPI